MGSQNAVGIGALARATGVPVETIRTWERRYGFPSAQRLPSGHRRYAAEAITQLRWIKRALDAGFRASHLAGLTSEELQSLVTQAEGSPAPPASAPEDVALWLAAVAALDATALERHLTSASGRLGLLAFLDEAVGTFLRAVGDRWAVGVFSVAQEHFASEVLRDFLAARWRPLAERARGPAVVLSTLPGEAHHLGLHMAATAAALAGLRLVFLGPDTPSSDTARVAEEAGAFAVLVSISTAAQAGTARRELAALRGALPVGVALVAGGGGAPPDAPGVQRMEAFATLYEWCQGAAAALRTARPKPRGHRRELPES